MQVDLSVCMKCEYYGGLNRFVPKVFCKRYPPPNCNNLRNENDNNTKVDCFEKPLIIWDDNKIHKNDIEYVRREHE